MPLRYAFLAIAAGALFAQHSETALSNPFNTAGDRTRGAAFFQSQCANCHGPDGKGGANGPNLASGNFRHATSEEAMFRVITKGLPGTPMPGFAMNGREIWQIVSYVRSLSAGRAAAQAAGNAARGAEVYAAQKCAACHWINGAGAPAGLDLSDAARRLSPAELRGAIENPDADVAPQYWIWQAKTTSGAALRGHRLNEDTFTVQILDNAGKLRSIPKSTLSDQTLERRSPMPSFKGKISDTDMTDLVAYLASLRGGAR